jgi:acetyl esterase/lipase
MCRVTVIRDVTYAAPGGVPLRADLYLPDTVRSVADTHRLDPDRVGLIGSSAGGHLSALAGLTATPRFEPDEAPYRERSSRVQAVVVGYAPSDFLQIDAHPTPTGRLTAPSPTIRTRCCCRAA